jgi:outer membrane protein TolC
MTLAMIGNTGQNTSINDLTDPTILSLEEQMRALRQRFAVGEVTQGDIDALQAQLDQARQDAANAGAKP